MESGPSRICMNTVKKKRKYNRISVQKREFQSSVSGR